MDLARFTAAVLPLWHKLLSAFKLPSTREPLPRSLQLGAEGERLAARFLQRKGYKVLYRNFQSVHGGEVDLVCRVRKRPELVFVEVKTRSSESFGAPHEAVRSAQKRAIVRAAQEWLEMLDQPEVIARFDIVEIIAHAGRWEVRHLENAFLAEETLHPGSLPATLEANRAAVHPTHERASGARFRHRAPRC
jgi:putative endonuclease